MRVVHVLAAALMVMGVTPLSAEEDPASPGATNVTFSAHDGTQLHGYLAVPAGSGKHAAVLMVHEWWGLNRDTTILADALAAQGYIVLAADAFRGSVARTPAEASRLVSTTSAAQIASDLDAALDYLKTNPRVDSQRVAVLGFCFGGTQAMRMGTRRPDLAGVVIFYGSGPITDPRQLGTMKEAGPVLGIFGAKDANIPASAVAGFQKALDAAGVTNEIETYPDVGHAFVKSTTYRNGGSAQRAWERMLGFLKQTLS